jgi:hypothetical protein
MTATTVSVIQSRLKNARGLSSPLGKATLRNISPR